MKISRLQTALALILPVLAQRAAAQTLSLSPTSIGSVTHYYSSDPLFGNNGDDQQSFTFSTPSVELINFNTIQVTVSAPTGQMWQISDPAGISSPSLAFELMFGGTESSPYATITSANLQFDNFSGTPGVFSDNSGIPDFGSVLGIAQTYQVNGDFSFTGFTDTITYDNSAMTAAALASFNPSVTGLQYNYTPVSNDPGQLMTIVPAPEPSTLALAGLGGLTGLLLLRRCSAVRVCS